MKISANVKNFIIRFKTVSVCDSLGHVNLVAPGGTRVKRKFLFLPKTLEGERRIGFQSIVQVASLDDISDCDLCLTFNKWTDWMYYDTFCNSNSTKEHI